MKDHAHRAIAVVGVGAVLPEAPDAKTFWQNIKSSKYSIVDTPAERWDPQLYYDPDPKAPEKTYSKIGGWVQDYNWDPLKWRLPIPPKVSDALDLTQKWAIISAREALLDYGYPERSLDKDRTAVIFGNAMAGDQHYRTALRVFFPEFAEELGKSASLQALPLDIRRAIEEETRVGFKARMPTISEDTMPGELANIIAGRVAAMFDFHGPNFTADAACASAMAAINAAIEGLEEGDYDAVLTGGVDSNMSASSYVKFCKIGALSATGTRPYDADADGFVMGEGAAVFMLKRLDDAEADGDRIYAVIRGVGGSSDGRGKGITAPNPVGQRLAVERAWLHAGLSPATASLIEGHGTSTRVGDVVEVQSLADAFSVLGAEGRKVPLGSVKSNIGHLKGAAGAAGILKTVFALHEKTLPPSLGLRTPNPKVDFDKIPFYVNTELKPWEVTARDGIRRAGVSAFGFGGTNFHAVLEEYVPGHIVHDSKTTTIAVTENVTPEKAPLRGALVIGASSAAELRTRVQAAERQAHANKVPPVQVPEASDLNAEFRLAVHYADAADLAKKLKGALRGLDSDNAAMRKLMRAQGVFVGEQRGKVAFMYTGQGSQYLNMLRELREHEPVVRETFAEADEIMKPFIGRPLSEVVFVDSDDPEKVKAADHILRQTEITQPAVLTVDTAFTRLLATYGIEPDMVMGHSLGEYGALVAAGTLTFAEALEAVSARGREMTRVSWEDNGLMAAVMAPVDEVRRIIESITDDYAVIANLNSHSQSVVGGTTSGVTKAVAAIEAAGHRAVMLPVSHAFHTRIVAPASGPLRSVLERMQVKSPTRPIVSNVTGDFYPMGDDVVPKILDLLAQQISSPVQFVDGLETLYKAGVRTFVEVGPKKALHGFAEDVFQDRPEVMSLFTNHPKVGEIPSFNQALCGVYASGKGYGRRSAPAAVPAPTASVVTAAPAAPMRAAVQTAPAAPPTAMVAPSPSPMAGNGYSGVAPTGDRYSQLGQLFAELVQRGVAIFSGADPRPQAGSSEPIVISGAAIGLPGGRQVFDDENVSRILRGDQFIDVVPVRVRESMADRHITRLVKSEEGARFETIDSARDVIKLAARAGDVGLVGEFGYPDDRIDALDRTTMMAIGVGLEALRDAGIPLVLHYKTTSKGTKLPEKWMLPDYMRDDTGVIFGSAFPGYDRFAEDLESFYQFKTLEERVTELETLRARLEGSASGAVIQDIDTRIRDLKAEIERLDYKFDRRFVFRILAMGHSQFAEYIGARGPNTQINGACASGTQAVGIAQDWIRQGRCRRVIIVTADDVTSDRLMGWIGAGFLASGAAATDESVAEAALPFDRRRHGLLLGMGASGMLVESAGSVAERGMAPIVDVLATEIANSAFHGSRLDVNHICDVMERMVARAEAEHGLNRHAMAQEMVFVSHETYTPARGGSASAEVFALRHVFGAAADSIVIANTKGMTGHAMGAGIEDVTAVKILETGVVPPVVNFKEVDPELGNLNLSKGGNYPVRYALRLGAGFGSQISMSIIRWTPTATGTRPAPTALGYQSRLTDRARFEAWAQATSGYAQPEVEVAKRVLRFKDQGPADRATAPQRMQMTAPAPMMSAPAPVAAPMPAPAIAAPRPVVAPPAASAPPPAPAAPAPVNEVDPVQVRVMAIVSEKTGYPEDMLDLDLDLEADLGIDTVKQAETFAAVREAYDIPRVENLQLRDFPTMQHVIQFVRDRRPDLAAAPSPRAAQPASIPTTEMPAATTGQDPVASKVLAIVSEKTGYPSDMLDLDLDLEADLGIDTVKQAETFAAVREAYDIPRVENLQLRDFPTMQHVIQFVLDRRPDLAAAAAPAAAVLTPAAAAAPAATGDDPVANKVLEIVSEKTGYPSDMLDLDLDLEADLGIDTVKQAETFAAVREAYDIPRVENLQLRDFPTMQHVIQFVRDRRPDLAPVSAPVAAPASGAGPVSAPAGGADDDTQAITNKVLEIVSQKTGYPSDMLDLDLDLEADLGIDTVKQAETFAAVREAYNIPRQDDLQLREFPTMQHVVQFVLDRRPDLVGGAGASAETPAAPVVQAAQLADADAVPRRVPVAVVRPPLSMCKPTGVKLEAGTRVIVALDRGMAGADLARRLEANGVTVLAIEGMPSASDLEAMVEGWLRDGPVHGVYWLPALDGEREFTELSPDEWHAAMDARVKRLFTVMRVLEQHPDPARFVVTGARLGGRHGYDDAGAICPLGGAVTGFTKAVKREKPEALVKAVDFGHHEPDFVAGALFEETLRDPGVVEVGYFGGHRWTVTFDERPAAEPAPEFELGKDSVFVVTGAAGSIVSAIIQDMAAATGGHFHMLDLTPEPDPQDPDLRLFAEDREALKRQIFERMKAQGERATPAKVEKVLAGLERKDAAAAAIRAVEAMGGKAYYHQVNLLDADAVARVVESIRQQSGRIDSLIHAAGLEISHLIGSKAPEEFDLVFDVKSLGWFHLMRAIGDMELKSAVVFSSIAGRFGNGGQTDYSAANDLLCKMVSYLRRARPQTRGVAIDWTAWAQFGMAARGSIPAMMELARIDMLPPAAGIPVVRRELVTGYDGEIIVAGELGILVEEFDETGGLDIAAVTSVPRGPMHGNIVKMGLYGGLTVETTLDPKQQPFLYDHQIDDIPVLPGVMGVEAFAEVAGLLFADRAVTSVERVEFMAPFKFYRHEPRTVTVSVQFTTAGDDLVAHCRLVGSRMLPNRAAPQVTTHFQADVRLGASAHEAMKAATPSTAEGRALQKADIYEVFFHGPAYQVLDECWRSDGVVVGRFADNLPNNHQPADIDTQLQPRLIELVFQTAGLSQMGETGRMGLPHQIDRVEVGFRSGNGASRLFATVRPQGDAFDAEVVDEAGDVIVKVHGYRTVELPTALDEDTHRRLQEVLGAS